MIEEGIVVDTQGQHAVVRMAAGDNCKSCGICSAAGGGQMLIKAENHVNAGPGDAVRVMIPAGSAASAGFILYMAPLGAFIAGAVCGHHLAGLLGMEHTAPVWSLGVGIAFLAGYYGAVRYQQNRLKRGVPSIISSIHRGTSPGD